MALEVFFEMPFVGKCFKLFTNNSNGHISRFEGICETYTSDIFPNLNKINLVIIKQKSTCKNIPVFEKYDF